MEFVRVKKDFDVATFISLRDEMFDNVYSLLHDVVRHYDNSRNYPIELYETFLKFHKSFKIDFELNLENFNRFNQLNFNSNDWIVIYKIFNTVLDYCDEDLELDTFIKLFYSGLILTGPFSEDFRHLDISYDLLELMSDEIKKLFWLFDDYFNNPDSELIKEIKTVCKEDAVPFCISYYLAEWMNDTEEAEIDALELYVVAINKIYKRPVFYRSDLDYAASIRVSLDTSWKFSDDVINRMFSEINEW